MSGDTDARLARADGSGGPLETMRSGRIGSRMRSISAAAGEDAASAWGLLGSALMDFFNGDASARIAIRCEDGAGEEIPLRHFFREPATFSELERTALGLCRGRVLDVGAGSGCHSLELQALGLAPCAIDAAQGAVQVMERRGVREVQHADVLALWGGAFDSVLMLMNGAGLIGRVARIGAFLDHARGLLRPGGEVLLDSVDPFHLEAADAAQDEVAGAAFSDEAVPDQVTADAATGARELRCRLEYRGKRGRLFDRLFVAPATLGREASRVGWFCQVVFEDGEGAYLARLTPLAGGAM